jgi:hypothetical protein
MARLDARPWQIIRGIVGMALPSASADRLPEVGEPTAAPCATKLVACVPRPRDAGVRRASMGVLPDG